MKRLLTFFVFVCLIFAVVAINSCKKDPVPPTLTTTDLSNITTTSATTGGVITKDGGAAVTARGVCWGTTTNPSISDSHTSDGTGVGSFTSNLTGLTPNTQYHVRAYATNKAGTSYGTDIPFTSTAIVLPSLTTTAVTSITLTTASSGGNISADGNAPITAKGVCWATTTAPTVTNSKTSDGTGTGAFTSAITGLLPGTSYFLRAYATNSAGTAYGNEVTFTTTPIAVPTLTTNSATSVTLTTAVVGGNITADGGAAVTAKGTCWALTANPTVANSKTSDGNGTGNFTSTLTGLVAGTTYHARAYATNTAGTAYGNDITFTTSPILVPTLTTTAASLITLTTAVAGGNITADGGGAVTARGTCWSTTANPTTTNTKTSDATGTGSFISNLTGLLPGTTYHIRAYATNSAGTAYGNDLSFTTTQIGVPTLTTTAVTSVTLTTAASGGNITADGGDAVSARGICWSTTSGPTTNDAKTSDATGTGVFTSNMSLLLPGTTYYVRAYATNSAGTAYGNEVSFTTAQIVLATLTTTAATSVTLTTASSGGDITNNGGGTISAKGVCWALTATPTISNFTTSDGTGTGVFTSSLTGLTPGATYHLRAYATNEAGTAYGNEIIFTTGSIVVPTLTTAAITSITLTTAVSGGNITYDGGASVTARGVCWSTAANPTITDPKSSDASGTGIFASNLVSLLPGTIYHVRAYATNSAGTAYGNDLSFTTTAVALATLTTTAASAITMTTASSGGNITDNGGGSISARGVCWATTINPVATGLHTTDGAGSGIFTSSITGLSAATTYHIRAYATNSAGTAYGNDLTFTSGPAVLPTLTTTAISAIALTTAVSGGNITDDGGAPILERGICWTLTGTPTLTDNPITSGTGSGSFVSNLTGLTAGTEYHVRAYARNSVGTAYGALVIFNTNMADIEGNTYKTVTIGTQVWMAENLKTTMYKDNTPIPNVTDNSAWYHLTTPAYCWLDNLVSNKDVYGALYNWFTMQTGDLCPTGWHVPTDIEFDTMEGFLGLPTDSLDNYGWRGLAAQVGSKLKSATGWAAGSNGTNQSGFSALPGGYRYAEDGTFVRISNGVEISYWWTSTSMSSVPPPAPPNTYDAWYRMLYGNRTTVYRSYVEKQGGKYVRCVKD
jgi:uncharacterized protein (TIGR02145 family)